MFFKILIPLDGSEVAEAALEPCQTLARASGAQIHLFRAREIPDMLGYPMAFPVAAEVTADEHRRCEAYLERLTGPLRAAGFKVQSQVGIAGDPAGQIAKLAERERCDLVIMTSHGHSGFAHALMGSVAEKVSRMSPCPVMIVGCRSNLQRRAKQGSNWAPVPVGREFKRILVPLDGSKAGEASLPAASFLARTFRAEVKLVSVEEMPQHLSAAQWDMTQASILDGAKNCRLDYLNGCCHELRREGCLVTQAVLPLGSPAISIVEEAEAENADLIVLSSHGRSGLSRLLLGSVAEHVAHAAPCPVMIMRRTPAAANLEAPGSATVGLTECIW